MKRKTKKFQMRMKPADHRLLMKMANQDRLNMSEWLEEQIRNEAKRRKLK